MRTPARISVGLLLTLLVVGGCGGGQEPLGVPGLAHLNSSGDAGAASAPTEIPFVNVFEDLNPCSGVVHTVTMTGTLRVHEHDGRVVGHSEFTLTTSSGFVGRGTETFVANGNVVKFTINAMLTNDSGDRIRAHVVQVVDLSTSTVRVLKGSLTCLGRPK